MSSAKWIPARDVRDTDVLEFQGFTMDGFIDGVPIDKLTRYPGGRVKVDVTYADGTHRYKIYAPDDQVCVHDRGTDTPIRDVIQS